MRPSTAFCGLVILGACACGAGAGMASVSGAIGFPAASGIFYATILTTGAVVFLWGLRGRRTALMPGVAGLAVLMTAALLAPPRTMSDSVQHSGLNLAGFVLYLVAAGLILWTVVRLTGYSVDALGGLILGSAALAAGCTCCLTPGAIRYSAILGGIPSWMVSRLALVLLAFVAGSIGFYLSGRRRAWAYFALGVALVYPIEKLAEYLVPSLQVGAANLVFLIRYPIWLTGTALVFYGVA